MGKRLLSVLLVLLTGSAAVAQDITRFKVLSDSAYQTNTQYKSCNRYQKDAILFMDLVADTHPYYVRPELREEWYAKKETLLEKCKSIETDEALADALNKTLGKQKDKHTCVTTAKQVKEATLAEQKKLTEAGITSFAPDREHIMQLTLVTTISAPSSAQHPLSDLLTMATPFPSAYQTRLYMEVSRASTLRVLMLRQPMSPACAPTLR